MRKKRILTEEHKRKIGLAQKGKKRTFSSVAIENIRLAAAKRKGIPTGKRSAEIGEKISASKKGVPVPEERKERIRNTLRGRKNPEHSKKLKEGYASGIYTPWNKGKIFDGKSRSRSNGKYALWKKLVNERDGYKCMECKSTEKLHTHHIIPWKVDESKRFDVDNGITLCCSCHAKKDKEQKKNCGIKTRFQKGHKGFKKMNAINNI